MKHIMTILLLMPFMALAGTIGEALNCTSLTWTTGGTPSRSGENVNWTYNTDDSYSDGASAVSGAGGAGDATSWLKTTVVGPCKISFRYKVQTYNGSFTVFCDSSTLYNYTGVTGTSPSWQYAEYDVTDGSHEIKFQYHHPGVGYAYQFNGARVDNFSVRSTGTIASALDTSGMSFTTGGNADWFVESSDTHDGQDAVRSGAIGNSQSSWMQTTINGAKQVSFWWKVSSESNYDFLKFYVDGVEKKSISGTGGNWSQETVQVTGTGTHTLKWRYSKDGSVNNGDDCGWVDQLVITDVQIGPSTTYYVNGTTGSDANSGLSESAAKKTIQAAINASCGGDVIRVKTGRYSETISLSKAVSLTADVRFGVVIDGQSRNHCIDILTGANGFCIDGFVLTNGRATNSGNTYGGGIACRSTGRIRNCEFRNNGDSSQYFAGGLEIHGEARDVVVENCLFVGNVVRCSGGGVLCEGTASFDHCTIWGNTCSSWNQIGGFAVASGGSATIKNSIIWNNNNAEVGSYSGGSRGTANISYSCVEGGYSGTGNIAGNPVFAETDSDFALSDSSPCKGSGENGCDMGFQRTSQSLTDGLVAWYKFDGDASDSSGNGNHGTVNGAILTADRFGNASGAYKFNGYSSANYIQIPNSSTLYGITRTVSVSAWIRPDAWEYPDGGRTSEPWLSILCKGNYTRQFSMQIGGSGLNRWAVSGDGNAYWPSVSTIPTLGAWHHAAMTDDGETIRCYLDGVLIGSCTAPSALSQTTEPLYIGRDRPGALEYYNGAMDDLRIYNRALSAAEVRSVYAGEFGATSRDYVQSGLKGQWDGIDNVEYGQHSDSANVWADLTGNGWDATKQGSYGQWQGTGFAFTRSGTGYFQLPTGFLSTLGSSWTIEAYVRPTAEAQCNFAGICGGHDRPSAHNGLFLQYDTDGLYVGSCCNYRDQVRLKAVKSGDTWPSEQMTYIAVCFDNDTHIAKAYLNGECVAVTTNQTSLSALAYPSFWIGRAYAASDRQFDGSIYAVRAYSRALSNAEIVHNYTIDNVRFDESTVNYHVVTFNANGGTAVSSRRVEDGAAVGELPTATKDGAEFLGWFTAATGGTQVSATRTITEDVTFYAHWREIPLSDAIGGGAYAITTGGDGNWFAESANKVEDPYAAQSGAIGDGQSSWMQTTVTGPNEVSFKWMVSSEEEYDWLRVYVDGVEKDAISGSVNWREVTLTVDGEGEHIIRWTYAKDGSVSRGDDCGRVDALTVTPVVEWTVTFNANGGTASFAEKSVVDGQAVGSLPTAEREGFDFDGWYTAALGGSEVTAATVVSADVEYFAHWRSQEVVPTYGPWGESSAVKNPDKLGPTYLQNMSVTIYGTPAEEGDVVAVYREDTDALCGLGKVMDESGRVTLVYYAPKGTILTFKVWLGASGVTNPTILDCDATCNLEAPDVGSLYSEHALRVTDDESLTITLADEDWHCISFNVAPDDASPSVVFGDVANKIAAVTQGIDFWMPGQPSSLKKIEIGKGYWVKTTAENVSWTVYGKTVPDTEIELEAGWNLVGYAGERSGRIAQVMRTAIADGVVGYITCGIEFYPGGTLTTMEPGKAYWVYASEPYTLKYDAPRALMMAKAMAVGNAVALTAGSEVVPTYGPWGESDAVKNSDKLASTMLLSMPLTFDGDDAEEGDVVAAYRQDTGALCGLGKVLDDSGTLTMVCYAPKGVKLHFKAWVAASGINEPQIFDCDEDSDLIAPEVGAFVNGHELVVSTEDEILTVVPGAKVDIDTGLVGYTPKNLPNGLKYDKNSGRIIGSATKPTGADGVVVAFTKSGADTEKLTIVVAPIPKIEVSLLGDTTGCKVTGAGEYLVGKKVTLSATAPKGTAFIGWFRGGEAWPNATDSAKAKLSYVMTAEDVSLVAKFEKEKMSVACAGLSYGSFVAGVAGAASGIPLQIETQSGVKSVAVKFTPSCGLTYDAKKQLITGAPTKTGEVKAEITVTAVSGAVEKKAITLTVAALPDMAVGTFNGFVGKTSQEEFTGHGTFTLTTTDAGKLTAKVVDAMGSYSFSAASWDSISAGLCTAKLLTKKGEVLNLSLDTTAAWNAYQLTGTFAAGGKTYEVSAQRKAFGSPWYFTATGDVENGWTLGYAASAKESVLTVTMKADGTTALAGTLGGNKISASGFVDVSGMTNGVLFADFIPVVSVKAGKSTAKKAMYIRTNLWFDRKSGHEAGTGFVKVVE